MDTEVFTLYFVVIVLAVLLTIYLYLVNDQGALRAVCTAVGVMAVLFWALLFRSVAAWIWQFCGNDYFFSGLWAILFILVVVLALVAIAMLVPQSCWRDAV